MTTKHTPGPWQVARMIPESAEYARTIKTIDGEHIAHVCDFDFEFLPEVRANARLIAAAPDMLAALEALLSAVRQNIDGKPPTADQIFAQAGNAAIAAIAKAKGE